ncbi:putative entry exclusion protein TrbK-alt [Sphingomonas sp. ID0503]|uniref:putative entry exclusion protein TrbK-alt n=1 Tax=Sphingomonas sp. ID0503 TaxID=3399691 RepID=UPI003AFB50CB
MDGKLLARIGAVVFVAVAITATAIEMTRKEATPERWPSGRTVEAPADPLRDALVRCQALGEEGPRDPECRLAWAENRRRFLAPGARPLERLPQAFPTQPEGLTPQAQPDIEPMSHAKEAR